MEEHILRIVARPIVLAAAQLYPDSPRMRRLIVIDRWLSSGDFRVSRSARCCRRDEAPAICKQCGPARVAEVKMGDDRRKHLKSVYHRGVLPVHIGNRYIAGRG